MKRPERALPQANQLESLMPLAGHMVHMPSHIYVRDDLQEFPENGWALLGLAQSLEAQGKTREGREVRGRFERAWKGADVTLKASVF